MRTLVAQKIGELKERGNRKPADLDSIFIWTIAADTSARFAL
jgi:hypothetical protein